MPWEGENGDTGDLFKYKVFRRSISRRDVNWPVSSKRKSKESTQAGTSLLFFSMDGPSIALRFNFCLEAATDVQAPGALHETTVWVKMSQEVFDRFDKKGEGYH